MKLVLFVGLLLRLSLSVEVTDVSLCRLAGGDTETFTIETGVKLPRLRAIDSEVNISESKPGVISDWRPWDSTFKVYAESDGTLWFNFTLDSSVEKVSKNYKLQGNYRLSVKRCVTYYPDMKVMEDGLVEVSCGLDLEDFPSEVIWRKDGKVLPDAANKSVLILSPADKESRGNYECSQEFNVEGDSQLGLVGKFAIGEPTWPTLTSATCRARKVDLCTMIRVTVSLVNIQLNDDVRRIKLKYSAPGGKIFVRSFAVQFSSSMWNYHIIEHDGMQTPGILEAWFVNNLGLEGESSARIVTPASSSEII